MYTYVCIRFVYIIVMFSFGRSHTHVKNSIFTRRGRHYIPVDTCFMTVRALGRRGFNDPLKSKRKKNDNNK